MGCMTFLAMIGLSVILCLLCGMTPFGALVLSAILFLVFKPGKK